MSNKTVDNLFLLGNLKEGQDLFHKFLISFKLNKERERPHWYVNLAYKISNLLCFSSEIEINESFTDKFKDGKLLKYNKFYNNIKSKNQKDIEHQKLF